MTTTDIRDLQNAYNMLQKRQSKKLTMSWSCDRCWPLPRVRRPGVV